MNGQSNLRLLYKARSVQAYAAFKKIKVIIIIIPGTVLNVHIKIYTKSQVNFHIPFTQKVHTDTKFR